MMGVWRKDGGRDSFHFGKAEKNAEGTVEGIYMILNFIGISWTRSDTIDWSVYHPLLIPMNRVYISVGLA
jgi:hypothetical protein